MNNQQIILNFLMLSVPEEFAMASIILILLKRFDYFDKENFSYNILKIFFIFVLPIAVISNLSLFKIKMASNVNMLINIALMIISILILNLDKIKNSENSKLEIIKTIILTIVGCVIFGLIEVITIVIVKYGFHTELVNIVNKSAWMNFKIVIPERIIQYGTIIFFIIKHNSLCPKLKMIDVVFKNKILLVVSSIFLITDIFIINLTWKYLFVMNILKNISISYQLFIVIAILSLIIINMFTILLIAICIYPREKYLHSFNKEE